MIKTKVNKEVSVKDKEKNHYIFMNYKIENNHGKDCSSVDGKSRKCPSELTEECKKSIKIVPKNQKCCIYFKDSMKYNNIGSILILTG